MVSSSRVFWPLNCLSRSDSEESLLIGWNNPGGDTVVVAALPYLDSDLVAELLEQDALLETNYSNTSYVFRSPLRNPIRGSRRRPSQSPIRSPLRSPLILQPVQQTRDAKQLYARFDHKKLSIVGSVNSSGTAPRTGYLSVDTSKNALKITNRQHEQCLVITFDPPNPGRMHYFALQRTKLYEPQRQVESERGGDLMSELDFHTSPNPMQYDNWDVIIAQLNCVYELQSIIVRNSSLRIPKLQADASLKSSFRKLSQTGPQRTSETFVDKSAPNPRIRKRRLSITEPKYQLLQAVMLVRGVIELGFRFLETAWIRKLSLVSLFCTAQQIDLKLNQLCYLPHEYIAIVKRSQQDWHWLTPDRNEAYIRFNNYIWLETNDLIFGGYLCSVIKANAFEIESLVVTVMDGLCSYFIDVTHWLMEWPAGFKLNTQLARFMGEVTIWIIFTWYRCLTQVFRPRVLQLLVSCLAYSGFVGGATLQISLLIDMLSVLTFHQFLMYQSLARVYSQQCHVLFALFRVFRGKKYNVLRHRVDRGDYDVHQLLLGTILFTVLLFLLPTIFAFYAVFALSRLAVLGIVGVLGVVLSFLNYFPLFPLLLRLKSPRRIPSGIQFEFASSAPTLHMKTKPMRLKEIFKQYIDTTGIFVKDFFNVNVLGELCTGGLVNLHQSKLYASLYSVLPSHRGSAQLLYAEISDYLSRH